MILVCKLNLKLVSEFGRVFEKKKLGVTLDKRKVIRCSRRGNLSGITGSLNGEPSEKFECIMYQGLHVSEAER